MDKIERERRFRRRKSRRCSKGFALARCGKKARRRTFVTSNVRSLPVSQKRERERERITRNYSGCCRHDYRRATRNPFSCFLQAAHAFTLAVTRNRLQIPVFLCILAGHYSAEQLPLLPVEAFALSFAAFLARHCRLCPRALARTGIDMQRRNTL